MFYSRFADWIPLVAIHILVRSKQNECLDGSRI